MEELPASKRVSTPAAPSSKPSKEQRQKKKKGAEGATKTRVTPNEIATLRIQELQSPSVGEAQLQRASTRSLSGTPSQIGNQGSLGSIPTSDHLPDSPNGSLESSAPANSLSSESPHATPHVVIRPMTGFFDSTSLHVHPEEALQSDLHHQPFEPHLPGYNYEPPLPDDVCKDLPLLSHTTTEETLRNTSPPFSLDSYLDLPIPLSTLPDYYHSPYPNGNNRTRIPSPFDVFNADFEVGSCSYGPKPTSDEIDLYEGSRTMTGSSNVGYSNVSQSQHLPENLTTHPSLRVVDRLALVKHPKAETGVSSKSSDRRSLPAQSNKRKREPTTFGDEGQRYYGFSSYDDAANYEEKSLACPFYKMNPKQYMACGERSIGNISALGQHIRQSHKSKPHSCKDCFEPFDGEAALRLHRESGPCHATEGCAVDDLGPVPRKCKGQRETWLWYWKKLFPRLQPPPSPYTDGFDVVGQFALSAIQDVISPSALDESLKSELIHRMLAVSYHWRKHPSAPLDYSQLSNHIAFSSHREPGLRTPALTKDR